MTTVVHGESLGKPTTPNSSSRIPELDGLRGFAILFVVLLHYCYQPGDPGPALLVHIRNLFGLGWSGVDLFFVLSGFLIGGILMDAKTSPDYFKTFYIRRFYRIIPIYYIWIVMFILLITVGAKVLSVHTHSHILPALGFSTFEQFFFLQNIWVPNHVTLSFWWLGITWSLAVEEQFYLVAPLAIRFLDVKKLRALLVAIIFVAPLLRTLLVFIEKPFAQHAYVSTPCRADSLAFGMLVALYWREDGFRDRLCANRRALTILLAVLFAGMAVLSYWYSNPTLAIPLTIGLSWIAFFYTVVLLHALSNPTGLVARFARKSWLRELGRVSYCVYLIHIAVRYFVFGLSVRTIPHLSDLRTFGLTLLSAALTYLIARLSWTYVEGPLIRIGHRTVYRMQAGGPTPVVVAEDLSSPQAARP
jgi:peptidoglycan/LPS O-acetylase OafA/YrhL